MKDTINLYVLQRKDKNGFKETIIAHQRCKGWKCIDIIKIDRFFY